MRHLWTQEPSYSGYVRGCRCDGCVDANRVYKREWMRAYRARSRR